MKEQEIAEFELISQLSLTSRSTACTENEDKSGMQPKESGRRSASDDNSTSLSVHKDNNDDCTGVPLVGVTGQLAGGVSYVECEGNNEQRCSLPQQNGQTDDKRSTTKADDDAGKSRLSTTEVRRQCDGDNQNTGSSERTEEWIRLQTQSSIGDQHTDHIPKESQTTTLPSETSEQFAGLSNAVSKQSNARTVNEHDDNRQAVNRDLPADIPSTKYESCMPLPSSSDSTRNKLTVRADTSSLDSTLAHQRVGKNSSSSSNKNNNNYNTMETSEAGKRQSAP